MKFNILVVPYMRARHERVKLAGSDPARFQILMEQIKTQMQFAESLGYDGFCMTEQHMQVEGIETTTNPLFWNYFVAQHTKKMRVGQLGMNLTAVNPVQLAENIAMLDHFTGGRVFAGFSRGNTPRWVGTFGQHLGITSTDSDKSASDERNRAIFYENWRIVKELWTKPTTSIQGEFWKIPPEMDWHFAPTKDYASETVDENGRLREVGIVPRPLQQPYPNVYAPFSHSMETVRFWGREGGKMVSFVTQEKEHFMPIVAENYAKAAEEVGRTTTVNEAIAIGGHLVLGRNPAESADIKAGFLELFKYAYDAPPYNVPVGRLWEGSRQQVADEIGRLKETFGVTEFFLWHHVGYFPEEVEFGMLEEFAAAVGMAS
ncbi:LLM class flavin-dependent oxidoreductase [Phyllobacterium sp. 22229]|uniref:LLM class flavin-dependent oxidoreductase n=1 Tax=Agrobacterium radiobacter TaxID=362 RepID=A0ABD5LL46_AGRRD